MRSAYLLANAMAATVKRLARDIRDCRSVQLDRDTKVMQYPLNYLLFRLHVVEGIEVQIVHDAYIRCR